MNKEQIMREIEANKKSIKIWQKIANKTKDKNEKQTLMHWIRCAIKANRSWYKELEK